MKKFSGLFFIILFSFVFTGVYTFNVSSADDAGTRVTEYIDVHTHLIAGEMPEGLADIGLSNQQRSDDRQPSFQRGPGMRGQNGPGARPTKTQEEYDASARNLITVMDRLGVQQAVVMSPPKTIENQNNDDYEKLNNAVKRYPQRLTLGAGGGTLNPLIQSTDKDNVTEDVYREFDLEVSKIVQSGARCFGEMAVLHISHNNSHVFEQTSADHPLFLRLADFSVQYGMPIDLHMDCVPMDMPTPRIWLKKSQKNPATLNANVPGLERLLEHNREAKIVWQHVGRDTMNQLTPELLRGLLSRHPNLYCALWARSPDRPAMAGPVGKNQILDENYQIKSEWLTLFQDFSDHFMIGTDAFVDSTLSKLDSNIEGTWKFVDLLPDDLKRKIGGENAKRVYGL